MSKIYLITNDINDKVYVGKTEFSIEKRFQEHCSDCMKERHEKRPLYMAMKKYGIQHFSIKEIEECSTEEAPTREQFWISFYKGYEEGYNATKGGDGKISIDREEILHLWNSGKSLKEITNTVHHDSGYISQILRSHGIPQEEILNRARKEISKGVSMIDKKTGEVIKTFSSVREAARYLIKEQNLKACSEGGYSAHICEVCQNKRKTCLGYKWQYSIL